MEAHQTTTFKAMPSTRFPGFSSYCWFFSLVSVCLLSFLPLILIIRNGVRVPFSDEWRLARLLLPNVTFDTFWMQNDEHRIFFPNLLFLVLIKLTGWNSVTMMEVSWAGMTGISLFLFYHYTKLFNAFTPWLWFFTVVVSMSMFLSTVQSENWLWAFQLSFFLAQIGAILSIFLISATTVNFRSRLVIALAFAVLASFSSAQGLMVWPALLVTLLLGSDTKRQKLIGLGVSLGAATLVYAAYFYHYRPIAYGHLQSGEALGSPQVPLVFFVGLIGAPLTLWLPDELKPFWAVIAGIVLLLTFLGLTLLSFRTHHQEKAAPWIGLAVFVMGFCAITTYRRAGFELLTGVTTSSYTTHELLFTLAVLALGYLAFEECCGPGRYVSLICFGCFLSCIGLCTLLGDIDGFRRGSREKRSRLEVQELLPFLTYFDPRTDGVWSGPFFPILPFAGTKGFDTWFKPYSERYIHTVKGAQFVSPFLGLRGRCSMSCAGAGLPETVKASGDVQTTSAIAPKVVFLREEGQQQFLAAAELHREKGKDHKGAYWWTTILPAQLLAERNHRMEMWVYDGAANTFLKVEQDLPRPAR